MRRGAASSRSSPSYSDGFTVGLSRDAASAASRPCSFTCKRSLNQVKYGPRRSVSRFLRLRRRRASRSWTFLESSTIEVRRISGLPRTTRIQTRSEAASLPISSMSCCAPGQRNSGWVNRGRLCQERSPMPQPHAYARTLTRPDDPRIREEVRQGPVATT